MGALLDPASEARFWAAAAEAERFFMGDARVQRAMRKLCEVLDGDGIPYAIAGAMALNLHGYERVTRDVAVLLTREGLAAFKERHLGLGYLEKFPGSKGLRDTENDVSIDVLLAGEFPGDGLPKPVAFPDPRVAAQRSRSLAVLKLPTLIELKLASGMSALHRMKDLADVIELVRAAKLPLELGAELDPSVREKYEELWRAAASAPPEE